MNNNDGSQSETAKDRISRGDLNEVALVLFICLNNQCLDFEALEMEDGEYEEGDEHKEGDSLCKREGMILKYF